MKLSRPCFFAIFLLAFLVRLIFVPNPGFEADVAFWKSWGLAPHDAGVVKSFEISANNYPTPFAYFLQFLIWIYSWFADPHNFNQFWSNTNTLFLTIAKLPAILADLGIAAIIIWIGNFLQGNSERNIFFRQPEVRPKKNSSLESEAGGELHLASLVRAAEKNVSAAARFLAIVYLFNPVAIMDGAWWGQVDSLGVFVLLLAFIMVLKKKPFLAGTIYTAAVMTKLQNMIYGPLFFLFLWQYLDFNALVKSLFGATIAFFGLNFEFLLSRNMNRVFTQLTANYDYFPLMSLNAYNLWWIVSGARGMQISDKMLVLGLLNAKTLGLLMFSANYLLAILLILLKRGEKVYNFLTALVIAGAAFFLFQTQSHDRYAFPLIIFLPIWFLTINHKLYIINFKQFLIFYLIFIILYFYNLHTAFAVNYPDNVWPILKDLIQPFFTITASVVHLLLFAIFLIYVLRHTKPSVIVLPGLFLIGAILVKNLPLLLDQPVPLTHLAPYVIEQGYGSQMTNMPVNASFGTRYWSPLSAQYYFFRQGLGTHAKSLIVYDLNRQFRRFTTNYGIDTEAGEKASSTFEVYGDDKPLFISDKMGRYDNPRYLEINVTGIRKLSLVANDADDGITDDHADWLRPTLWP